MIKTPCCARFARQIDSALVQQGHAQHDVVRPLLCSIWNYVEDGWCSSSSMQKKKEKKEEKDEER